jgi:hypothetical protein
MYAQIVVSVGELRDVAVVPGTALVERLGPRGEPQSGAYVVEDGVARFRVLSVLGRSQQDVGVEGVVAGDVVITLGHEQVHDGAAVRVAEPAESAS